MADVIPESKYLPTTLERLAGVDLGMVTFRDLFADVDSAYLTWLLSEATSQVPGMARLLPALPTEEVQKSFTGLSGRPGFKVAVDAYEVFRHIAEEFGLRPREGDGRALDFGCGWGRFTRVMMRDFRPENLIGVDVWQEALDHCVESGLPCRLLKVEPWPPMDIEANSIDLIIGYSVFSHLSEENQWAWIREFHRVLKPGGVVVMTTRGRAFIEYVATLRKTENLPPHAAGAARAFPNTEESLRMYDRGEYCFDDAGRGGGVLVGFYGEACIPKQYMERKWGALFSDTKFVTVEEHGAFDQNVLAARK